MQENGQLANGTVFYFGVMSNETADVCRPPRREGVDSTYMASGFVAVWAFTPRAQANRVSAVTVRRPQIGPLHENPLRSELEAWSQVQR